MTDTSKAGFFGTDNATYYRTPEGQVYCFGSDDFDGIRSTDAIPDDANPADDLMDPDDAVVIIRAIEELSGETLIETA